MKNISILILLFLSLIASSQNRILSGEYWFDSDMGDRQAISFSPSSSVSFSGDIDVSGLMDGLHTIHFRFADTRGGWCSTVSRFFLKFPDPESGSAKQITNIEYWFDSNLASRNVLDVNQENNISYIEQLDLSSLTTGLHTITARFRDNNMIYSPPVTRYFIKTPSSELLEGAEVTAYRYWTNDSVMHFTELETPSPGIILIDSIDMRLNAKGEYIVNMQFKDNNGRWSSAITDTINKLSYPYAVISTDRNVICAGDSIFFTANIIDADSLRWDFGDGFTADTTKFRHPYEAGGSYGVSLSVSDTTENITNIINYQSSIVVHSLPVIDLGETLVIQEDESVVLDAGDSFVSYFWNDIAGTNLHTVSGAGLGTGNHMVWVFVEDQYGCAGSDTLEVTVTVLTGNEDSFETKLRVYPNPVHDHIFVEWESGKMINPVISLVDLTGRVFISRREISKGEMIDLTHITSGRYILLIQNGGEVRSVPLVKL
jgi:PKD repeat protein